MDHSPMNQFPSQPSPCYSTSRESRTPEKLSGFSVASMICGIISIVLCCTGILSLPLGALGILFAVLSHRRGRSMPTMSLTGIILSCLGILMGLLMLVISIYMVITDPEFRESFEDSYEEYYEEFYEYGFENLDFTSTDDTLFLNN